MKMKLTYEELTTLTIEVEAVVNSCHSHTSMKMKLKKCYYHYFYIVEDDYLTNRTTNLQIKKLQKEHCRKFSKKMKQMNKIVERFWRIWQKKYLINLRKSHNVKTSQK